MGSPWTFVGRAHELARADALLAARTGILIVGDSGIGKSALARRIASRVGLAGRSVSIVDSRVGPARVPYEPFALVAGGSPDAPAVTDAAREVARRVAAAIGDGGVLVVDDAHLLDDGSARVLRHLAADGLVALVLAARASPLPADVARLWREGDCERLDLDGLTEPEVGEALQVALGGAIEPSTTQVFAQRSQGNPLLLRELVLAAERSAALSRGDDDVWRLRGDPPLSRGLRDLVAARLGDLDEKLAMGLEMLAVGEPLDGDLAADLIGPDILEELERLRLITVLESLGSVEVSTAHPLYGDVIRHRMPRLRSRRLRLDLARRIEEQPAPNPYDVVRAGLWRLEVGQPGDGSELLVAARAARGFGLDVAERLARAAYEASGSVDAAMLLAEVLVHSGKPAEAAKVMDALPPDSLVAADRDAVAYLRAMGENYLGGDMGRAAELIASVLAGDPSASLLLRGMHATMLAFDARFRESLDVGLRIVDDPAAPPIAALFAGVGAVGGLYWTGRLTTSVAVCDRLLEFEALGREQLPFAVPSSEIIAISALTDLGELDAAEARARALAALSGAHTTFARPRAEDGLGRIALMRGQLGAARGHFAAFGAAILPFDRVIRRHLGAAEARTAALAGDVASASAALAKVADLPQLAPYELDHQLAEAVVLAADMHLSEAADLAAWVAGAAAAQGQWTIVVAASLDAARYGMAQRVAEQMREAAEHVDGEMAAVGQAYVEALCRRDGALLDAASARFAVLGLVPLAAEAAAEAALAHADAHELRASRASGRRFAALRDACDGVVFPWLAGAAVAAPLTVRERQVAFLAAQGSADQQIAARLGISVRTVQTHLAHVYDKLGIRRRGDLAAALG